jgi:hypothetical protein
MTWLTKRPWSPWKYSIRAPVTSVSFSASWEKATGDGFMTTKALPSCPSSMSALDVYQYQYQHVSLLIRLTERR